MFLKVSDKLIINTDHIVRVVKTPAGLDVMFAHGNGISLLTSEFNGSDEEVGRLWDALLVRCNLDNSRMMNEMLGLVMGSLPAHPKNAVETRKGT